MTLDEEWHISQGDSKDGRLGNGHSQLGAEAERNRVQRDEQAASAHTCRDGYGSGEEAGRRGEGQAPDLQMAVEEGSVEEALTHAAAQLEDSSMFHAKLGSDRDFLMRESNETVETRLIVEL